MAVIIHMNSECQPSFFGVNELELIDWPQIKLLYTGATSSDTKASFVNAASFFKCETNQPLPKENITI